jgi:hypothetical protein
MQTKRLADIISDYLGVLSEIDAAEGEVTDDVCLSLDACEEALADKIERIEHAVEALTGKAKAVRARVAALEAHARACEAKAKRIHDWAISQLEAAGLDRYETDSFSLKQQKSPPRLEIRDEFALWDFAREFHPEWIKVEEKLDRKAALDAAKAEGGALPGADVVRGLHWRVS